MAQGVIQAVLIFRSDRHLLLIFPLNTSHFPWRWADLQYCTVMSCVSTFRKCFSFWDHLLVVYSLSGVSSGGRTPALVFITPRSQGALSFCIESVTRGSSSKRRKEEDSILFLDCLCALLHIFCLCHARTLYCIRHISLRNILYSPCKWAEICIPPPFICRLFPALTPRGSGIHQLFE